MASAGLRQCIRDVTPYLLYLILVATLGPLQFGFHLVQLLPHLSLVHPLTSPQTELNAPEDIITCKKREVADLVGSQPDSNLPQCIPMNDTQFGFLSSIFVLGGLLGALVAGPGSTAYGRLRSMRVTSAFFILGSAIDTFAGTVPIMSTGRFFAGIGAGASTVIVPLYISEVAPPKERGLFGTMTQVMINIGILFAQTLGYYLSKGHLWRIILAVGVALGVLQGIGLCFVPESPAWLAANKSPERAVETLQRIRGAGNSIAEEIEEWDINNATAEEQGLLRDPEATPRRLSSISRSSQKSVEHIGFYGVVRDPLYRPAIIAVVGIMFAQQFSGINSIMMYSVSLLSGVLPMSSSLLTIMMSIVNLVTTIVCAPLSDKIGRKACLLLSISGMGSMSLCLALSLRWEIKILSAISVLLFVAFFATGLGPVPFMMASELVGQEAVGATQSWCLASNYGFTFIVAQFFPMINTWLNERYGGVGWVYFIFTGFGVISFLFVSWRVPETKGKKGPDEVWGRDRRVD